MIHPIWVALSEYSALMSVVAAERLLRSR